MEISMTKFATISSIYRRSTLVENKIPVSPIYEVPVSPINEVPVSPINENLSPVLTYDQMIEKLQGAIEKKVAFIAESCGYGNLIEDEPHVLGTWVHAEETNLGTLFEILQDLKVYGETSYSFMEALDVLAAQFITNPSSPLEQFSIHPLILMKIGNFYFSFTNSSLFMLLTLVLVLLLLSFVTKKGGGKLVPNAWQSLVELIYDFVLNLVNEQIGGLSGNVKQKFFPCILVTFLFLLFCNLQGMIPFSFTVTSHFLITLALSFSIFIGITIVGFQRHGLHFFSFLLPAGVPMALAPFLVLLELISYCFRALSLGIRLFANMMAGHSLVKILSGFAWTMLFMNNLFYFIGDLGPLFIVLALTGLELGVAILQAYVFTILICIYLNDAINLH